jgi:xanthine dehydrogenase YagT iron-sulfur-binding subunit
MKLDQHTFGEAGQTSRTSSALLDDTRGLQHAPLDNVSIIGRTQAPLTLSINGDTVTVFIDPATTLVEVLRQHLQLSGTKIGCDRGACSACTVWIDGEVAASCMTFALDARDKKITTIEGLAQDGRLHPVQQAFIDQDALQCGFCTPGMVMSCAALLDHNPNPGLDDVKKAISGHLCRCGTYNNIFKAVLSASQELRGEKSNA